MGVIALLIVFLLLFPRDVLALSLSFSGLPAEIDKSQEVEINLSFTCQSCSDSYFRAVFFKEGTTNYFGYTQNEKGDWVNTTADKTLYFHLASDSLVEGSWSGKLRARLDPDHTSFTGSGNYSFKVGRYTSQTSSATWSENTAAIYVSAPTPTPTVTPTATPSPTTSPTPTLTTTPTNTAIPTKTPSPASSTKSPSPSVIKRSDLLTPTASVAALVLSASDSSEPEADRVLAAENGPLKEDRPAGSFTFVGILTALASLLVLIYRRIKVLSISAKVK